MDHDAKLRDDHESHFKLEPGEMTLGDLGYVGVEGFLYGHKMPSHDSQEGWDVDMEFATNLISFYRGRVESVIGEIKSHAWAKTAFRGRFEKMAQYYMVSLVLTAAQIRHNFETTNLSRFEVVGPWAHQFQ